MRQFLNSLFVLSEDAYLTLDGENVVVSRGKAEVGRVPLHTLESILCFSYAGASPALMGKCGRMGIDLSFYTPRGRFLARTVGEERGNVLLRQTQYAVAASEALSCSYARSFILGKVYNARWVLERATRDHPQRVPVDELKQTSAQLAAALPLVEGCEDPGAAARAGRRSCTAVLRPVQRADLTAKRCFCVYLPQPQTATGQCERAAVLYLFPAGQRLRRRARGCRAGRLMWAFCTAPVPGGAALHWI